MNAPDRRTAAPRATARLGKGVAVVAASATLLLPLTGCGVSNWVSNASAIGAQGTGKNSYEITARIPSAAGLVRNAPVMMTNATVGSVGDIQVDDWNAKITIRLEPDVKVPVGSHAMIGMTSVLGSSHLEIVPPAAKSTDTAYLQPGGSLALPDCPVQENVAKPTGKPVPDINSAQTVDPCRYPTTEQVLSSLSVVLNGGGLSQAGEIVHELSGAFGGRGDQLSSLIPRLETLVTDLSKQTDQIIAASEGLDRLSAQINSQAGTVERALASGPQILQLLVNERQNLVSALDSLGGLSTTVNEILQRSGDDIKVIVPNLKELMAQLANTGPALTNSLRILLTFPFLEESVDVVVKGDYVNSDLVLDLTLDRLNQTMVASLGLSGPEGLLGAAAGNARKSSNPLTAPFGADRAPAAKKSPNGDTAESTAPAKPATSTKKGGNR